MIIRHISTMSLLCLAVNFLIASLFIHTASALTFCTQDQITPVVDPSQLPTLPKEFSTRVQATFSGERASEAYIAYAYGDRRAEIQVNKDGKQERLVFYYDTNEYFDLTDNKCSVKQLNESTDDFLLLGLVVEPDGLFNMKPVEEFLHFNNDYPVMKLENTVVRGIPAIGYRSCQEWPEIQASYLVDIYFSEDGFQPPVEYGNNLKNIPLKIVVTGYEGRETVGFQNEYNFFDFKPFIEQKSRLYSIPEGVFCPRRRNLGDPDIPLIKSKSISFVEQFVIESQNLVDTNRITYSNDLKLIRFDTIPFTGSYQGVPVRVVHDYNSGVAYLINRQTSRCLFTSLEPGYDGISLGSAAGGGEQIKDPNQLFFIDSQLVYSGSNKKRDIDVDEFRSTRTDFKSPFLQNQPANWIVSHFFMKAGLIDEASDANVDQPPVTVEIQSSPEMNEKYTINIFDFDPAPLTASNFDVSNCYRGKEKTQFAIQFLYPQNYTQQELESIMQLENTIDEYFYKAVMDRLLGQNFMLSPLRLISPKIRFHRRGFEVYTGITDNAPAIYHFRKVEGTVTVNVNMAPNKAVLTSADDCAFKCLNDSTGGSKCLSFDTCRGPQGSGFTCVFYTTFVTDPSLIQANQPACDHYSKNVETFDASSKEELYRAVEYSVVKRELKIEVPYGPQKLVFPANNIYPATFDASSPNNEGIVTGTTSFFASFRIVSHDMDFLVNKVEASPEHQIRSRMGVSIDECARLCRFEVRFKCESMSYEAIARDCKWSSVFYEFYENRENPYTNYTEGYTIYASNSLVDYVLFPFAVSPENDLKEYNDAVSTYQCAYKCTTEKDFKCKSFNFCEFFQGANFKVKCLLSDKHTHDMNSDNLTFSAVCSHYSRQNLDDFTMTPGKQLNAKPVSVYERMSVEACASLCEFSEGFVCRSFDFHLTRTQCYLYSENAAKGTKLISNDEFNHYSRDYFTENGEDLSGVVAKAGSSQYSGGAIFGVTVGFIVLGVILGAGAIFIYAFYIRGMSFSGSSGSGGGDVPHMTFKNPASE